MKIAKYLISILFLFIWLTPFIVWNGVYEGPKVFWLLTGGVFLIVFWIYRLVIRKQEIVFKKTDYFYLLWLLVLTVASILGVHLVESVLGGSYRHQGVIFFFTLWLIYKTVEIIPGDKKAVLYKGIAWAVILEAFIILIQYATKHVYFGRPLGTLGEANAVAGFLAIGSVLVYENLPSLLFAIPFISILIAESRSGALTASAALVPVASRFGGLVRRVSLILLAVFCALFLVLVSKEKSSSPFENRVLIWNLGVNKIASRPVLGYGAESGEAVYDKAFAEINLPLDGLIVDRSHNLVLDVMVWSGLVGLIPFSLFIYERFKELRGYRKYGLISFLLYSMFQPLSVVHWLFLFLL